MDFFRNLQGRVALVAGATTGIGKITSQWLANQQVQTFMADIKPPEEEVNNTKFLHVDLSAEETADKLFSMLSADNALPDILICNVGKGIQEKLMEGDPAKWQQIINLNFFSHLRLVRAFVPAMMQMKKADVVFTSSVAANQPHPYGGIYSASKAALQSIAETLRQECLPQIRVSTITPGVVNTEFFNNQIGGDASAENFGWGYLEPEDIAEAILFVLSRPDRVAINNITIRPRAQTF